jgi:hypothetical protein
MERHLVQFLYITSFLILQFSLMMLQYFRFTAPATWLSIIQSGDASVQKLWFCKNEVFSCFAHSYVKLDNNPAFNVMSTDRRALTQWDKKGMRPNDRSYIQYWKDSYMVRDRPRYIGRQSTFLLVTFQL